MFALPSIWNLIVSTIVFFIAAWYLHRYLEEQGLHQGNDPQLAGFRDRIDSFMGIRRGG